ncbi:MAG: hypothetical protein ACF8XB_01990 [Planctomycetota bacterium JB042]
MDHRPNLALAALAAGLLLPSPGCSKAETRRAERDLATLDRALDGDDPGEVLGRLPARFARRPDAALDEAARALDAAAGRAGIDLDGGTWRVLGDAVDAFPTNPIVSGWLDEGRRDPLGGLKRALATLPRDEDGVVHALRSVVAELEPALRAVDAAADGRRPRSSAAIAKRLERLARDTGRFELGADGATRTIDVVKVADAWLPRDLATDWLEGLDRVRARADALDLAHGDLATALDRLERELGALAGAPDEATLRARLEAALGVTRAVR